MRSILAIALLILITAHATAAPAPLPKPARTPDTPPTVEEVRQIMFFQHGIQADQIHERSPKAWLVVGNTPMIAFGRRMYEQKVYVVNYTGRDRSGNIQVTVSDLTRSRLAITR